MGIFRREPTGLELVEAGVAEAGVAEAEVSETETAETEVSETEVAEAAVAETEAAGAEVVGRIRELARREVDAPPRRPENDAPPRRPENAAPLRRLENDAPPRRPENAAPPRRPENEGTLIAGNIGSLLQRVSASSLQEIDALISELKVMREKLHEDGRRVHRQIVQYASLSQTAMQSTRAISESLGQWKKMGPVAPRMDEGA
jgi:hypothetical protein